MCQKSAQISGKGNNLPLYFIHRKIKQKMVSEKDLFRKAILKGIPNELPKAKPYEQKVNHAPKRKDILTGHEKKLSLQAFVFFLYQSH